MSSDQQYQPMVQGTLALKEIATNTPTDLPAKGPQLVQSIPPTKVEVSTPNLLESVEVTPARQFFIDLRENASQAPPPFVAKKPENRYETNCGQCGEFMIFRNPLTDWTKVFCGRCGESVWVR
jgi:hypothetical protein